MFSFRIIFLCFVFFSSTLSAYQIRESLSRESAMDRLAYPAEVVVIGGDTDAVQETVTEIPQAQKIYNTYCSACHAQGIAGAPKFGVKSAWASRMKQGRDVLVKHALQGIRAMPAKGTCVSCSDEDIAETVDFMLSQLK